MKPLGPRCHREGIPRATVETVSAPCLYKDVTWAWQSKLVDIGQLSHHCAVNININIIMKLFLKAEERAGITPHYGRVGPTADPNSTTLCFSDKNHFPFFQHARQTSSFFSCLFMLCVSLRLSSLFLFFFAIPASSVFVRIFFSHFFARACHRSPSLKARAENRSPSPR